MFLELSLIEIESLQKQTFSFKGLLKEWLALQCMPAGNCIKTYRGSTLSVLQGCSTNTMPSLCLVASFLGLLSMHHNYLLPKVLRDGWLHQGDATSIRQEDSFDMHEVIGYRKGVEQSKGSSTFLAICVYRQPEVDKDWLEAIYELALLCSEEGTNFILLTQVEVVELAQGGVC